MCACLCLWFCELREITDANVTVMDGFPVKCETIADLLPLNMIIIEIANAECGGSVNLEHWFRLHPQLGILGSQE